MEFYDTALAAQLKEANSIDDNDYYVDVVGNAEENDAAAGQKIAANNNTEAPDEGYVNMKSVEVENDAPVPAVYQNDENKNDDGYVDVVGPGSGSCSGLKRKICESKIAIVSLVALLLSILSIFLMIGIISQVRNDILSKSSTPLPSPLTPTKEVTQSENNTVGFNKSVFLNFIKQIFNESYFEPTERHAIYNRRDCSDVFGDGFIRSGIYSIKVPGRILDVYCDLENDGGNWTVIQRRVNGSVNFFRTWKEYLFQFGHLSDEFWLGLETLHYLTTGISKRFELLINLEDWNGNTAKALYRDFLIGDEQSNYMLNIGRYSGTAGDSLRRHNRLPFSTKDRDNDQHESNCAAAYGGGWWYSFCHSANLNGRYLRGGVISEVGVVWYHWMDNFLSLKRVEMKIRPIYD